MQRAKAAMFLQEIKMISFGLCHLVVYLHSLKNDKRKLKNKESV